MKTEFVRLIRTNRKFAFAVVLCVIIINAIFPRFGMWSEDWINS
jgi:low affinity Fe/Cu permease